MAHCMIHADNVKYFEIVCARDHVICSFGKCENDMIPVDVSASNKKLRELLRDTLCEKQRDACGISIPVYSLETLENPGKFSRLARINHTHDYMPLEKDLEDIRRKIFQM